MFLNHNKKSKLLFAAFFFFISISCNRGIIGFYKRDCHFLNLRADSSYTYKYGCGQCQTDLTGKWKSRGNVISFVSDVKTIKDFSINVTENRIDTLKGTIIKLVNYQNKPIEYSYVYCNTNQLIQNIFFTDSIYYFQQRINIDSLYVIISMFGGLKSTTYLTKSAFSNYFDIHIYIPEFYNPDCFINLDSISLIKKKRGLFLNSKDQVPSEGLKRVFSGHE